MPIQVELSREEFSENGGIRLVAEIITDPPEPNPKGTNIYSYELVDNPGDMFRINQFDRTIEKQNWLASNEFDFESGPRSFPVTVRVTNLTTNEFTDGTFDLVLTDEPVSEIWVDSTGWISANAEDNAPIATFHGVERGESILLGTWAVEPTSTFEILSSTHDIAYFDGNILRVKPDAELDSLAGTTVFLTVSGKDPGGAPVVRDVFLAVHPAVANLVDLTGQPGAVTQLTGFNGSHGFSYDTTSIGDIDGDGLDEILLTFPESALPPNNFRTAFVLWGTQRDQRPANLDLDDLDAEDGFSIVFPGGADSGFTTIPGYAVSAAGDVNNDTYPDFLIGDPYADLSWVRNDTGRAYLFLGGPDIGSTGEIDVDDLPPEQLVVFRGPQIAGDLGGHLQALGDVNNDNYDDFAIIGLSMDTRNDFEGWDAAKDGTRDGTGRVYIVYGGPELGTNGFFDLDGFGPEDGIVINGEQSLDYLAYERFSTADVNGDNKTDFIIPSPFHPHDGVGFGDVFHGGKTYVIFGGRDAPDDGVVRLSELDGTLGFALEASFSGVTGFFGDAVVGVPDMNGDGIDEIVITEPTRNYVDATAPNGQSRSFLDPDYVDGFTKTYIVFGSPDIGTAGPQPGMIDVRALAPEESLELRGIAGSEVQAADLNGDGLGDLVLLDRNAGLVSILLGRQGLETQSDGNIHALPPTSAVFLQANGTGLSILDFDNDGLLDILVENAEAEVAGTAGAGSAFVVYGDTLGFGGPGPDDLQLNGSSIAENAMGDVAVGEISAFSGGLPLAPVSFQLLDDAGSLFALDGNILKLVDGAAIDYETATSHIVRISAVGISGPAYEEDFVIQVTNMPVADIALASGGTVEENAAGGTVVATFEASENPVEPSATFTLMDDANGLFVLDGNTLKLAPGAVIDYETATSHTVRIAASDATGPAYEEDFVIQVTNMPVSDIALASGGTVEENAAGGTVVATFEASENPVEPSA
ncbi:MAG: VCBS repeat-containing protein, partial [Notoacmeibacter sp.]|nr:VCBS repeat-containing protein [Notoacmeibacter sp.]